MRRGEQEMKFAEVKFGLAFLICFLSIYMMIMTLITNEPSQIDVNIASYFKSTWMTIFTFTLLISGYLLLDSYEMLKKE